MHLLFWVSALLTLPVIPFGVRAYQTRATPARHHFYELATGVQALVATIAWGCAILIA